MTFHLGPIELVLGLLVAATALAYLARRLQVPYPIVLVLGGLALGLVPDLPAVELEPEIVFLLFLPPILFAAGFNTPAREFKANLQPIVLLALGLVLFTTVCVAIVASALVPGLGLPAAFALGAIVAPPDAIAATAIFRRLGVPRRVVTILEGESLVNDATALIAYRFAVAAVLTGTFSLVEASLAFVVAAAGGILIGYVVGRVLLVAWSRTHDTTLEIMVSLLAPIAAYLPAEMVGASGVLAVVTAGLMAGRAAARVLSSEARLLGRGVWSVVIFLVNGVAFILIGLQLPGILDELAGRSGQELLVLAFAVSAAVVASRLIWILGTTGLRVAAARRVVAEGRAKPSVRNAVVVGWAGMRGVVSLAAALSLPHTLPNGDPFPERELILYLTLVVILVTLVGQGLTLPLLIRRFRIARDGRAAHEELQARAAASEAALATIGELELRWPGHAPLVDQLRTQYEHRATHADDNDDGSAPADEQEQELYEHRQIRRAIIDAEREAVIALRDEGVISDDVLRTIERDLDLEELRLEA